MLCNYDTDYFMESIVSVQGRRYNILPPDSGDPLVGRNISRDDVAGFFRALVLSEEHKSIVKFINHLQVADTDMIISGTGIKFNQFKKLKETCILTGLIFENRIKTEQKECFWYMIDTGGVYALEDMEVKRNVLPYTLSMEQKYKLFLKSQFVFDITGNYEMIGYYLVKDKKSKVYNVELLEEVKQAMIHEYKSTIFLVNLETLDYLNINSYAKEIAKILNRYGNKFYDISRQQFLEITD